MHRACTSVKAGEPIVIDKGRKGLEQSLHHPNAGASQFTQRGSNEPEAAAGKTLMDPKKQEIYNQIARLILHNTLDKVWDLILELASAREERARSERATSERSENTSSLEERITARITKAVIDGIGAGTQRARAL